MNWESLRERLLSWFGLTAQFCLLENVIMYIVACVVAHGVIGPVAYVAFLNHCCQWNGK